jgi:hypothetical protein
MKEIGWENYHNVMVLCQKMSQVKENKIIIFLTILVVNFLAAVNWLCDTH